MSEQTDAFNGVHDAGEKDHHQSDVLVDHLEQVVQDENQGYIAHAIKDFDHKAQPIEQFVCLDVVCRGRCVPVDNETTTNEDLGEYASDDDHQVQGTGDSGVESRPGLRDPIWHHTCAHSGISFSFKNGADDTPSHCSPTVLSRAVAFAARDSLAARRTSPRLLPRKRSEEHTSEL